MDPNPTVRQSHPSADPSAETHPAGPPTVVRKPAMAPENIASDRLLAQAPRMQHGGREVPCLGGIPLLSKLGQGGMGAVYYGVHPRLQQEVAVKVLPYPLVAQNPDMVNRFFREAQLAAKVKSPHLVGVLDVNEEAGLFYLVMEFVNGVTAGSCVKEAMASGAQGMNEATALEICIAATEGLLAAHDENVVHRDIKPENIMVPRSKQNGQLVYSHAKLADLGLARGEESGQSLTGAQTAMGTPGYMSPEQAMDAKTVKKPGDVFSMGATLYAMLCGHPPFIGKTTTVVILETVQGKHVPLQKLRPEVTSLTTDLVERCLKKDAVQRFPDARALLEALKASHDILRNSMKAPTAAATQSAFAPTVISDRHRVPADQPAVAGSGVATVANVRQTPIPTRVTAMPAAAPRAAVKPRGGGPWTAVVLVGALALIGGGIFLAMRTSGEGAFEEAREKALNGAKPALTEGDGARADAARRELEAFMRENASRSLADLQPVTAMIDQLKGRSADLAQRQRNFEQALAAADAEKAKPAIALAKLDEAEKIGRADPAKGYPDLLAALNPTLEQRKAALGAKTPATPATPIVVDAAAEQRYTTAMDDAARSFGSRNFEGAKAAYERALKEKPGDAAATEGIHKVEKEVAALKKAEAEANAPDGPKAIMAQVMEARRAGEWGKVVSLLEGMAKHRELGEEAEKWLAHAKTQLKAKMSLETKLKEADAALAQKDYAAAQRLYKEAQALDTNGEQANRINNGLQMASGNSGDQRYQKAMMNAHSAMDAQKFQEAIGYFQAALLEKPGDPMATQGIQDAKRAMMEENQGGTQGGTDQGTGTGPGPGPGPRPPPRRPPGR